MEERNAVIEGTMLGLEDHGIMSFYLYVDYGGSRQGAGGYALDSPVKDSEGHFLRREGTALGMALIVRILEVVGVDKWEDLKGKSIRVRADDSKVYEVGHLLKDNWLNFQAHFEGQE